MLVPLLRSEESKDTANFAFQMVVALVALAINGAMVWIVANVKIPTENVQAFSILLGNAMGWMGALIAFGFPNSIGAQKSADTIKKLADHAIDKLPPPTGDAKPDPVPPTATPASDELPPSQRVNVQ